jgi:Plasmid stabilization system protein
MATIPRPSIQEALFIFKVQITSLQEWLLNLFDEKISILAYFPLSGPIPNDRRLQLLNYRMLVVDSYLVFYVVHLEFIEIRRVLHGKRKYDFLL